MPNFIKGIEKTCTFLFNFSNINTLFIDKNSHILLEYGYNSIPTPLRPYFEDANKPSFLQEASINDDACLHSTSYHLNFITAKVYDAKEYLGHIIMGPYLLDNPSSLLIENVLFENKLSISLKDLVKQYYQSLPLISSYKAKLMAEFLVCSLANIDFMAHNPIHIARIKHIFEIPLPHAANTLIQASELATDSIEQTYSMENKLIDVIKRGDRESAEELSNDIVRVTANIPDRIPQDALRSRKNITFVLNTLLRKSAEMGGLHPIKIHGISEKFAIQIEKASSIQEIINLQKKMISTYCDSTYKYSLKGYTYLIRKTIEYIRVNLDQDLSLSNIARELNISPPELSRQFKKETNKAITYYINNLRINEAIYFLENQTLSITDIAYMVGFNDVNYFTKVFKKIKGVTPSQYRAR